MKHLQRIGLLAIGFVVGAVAVGFYLHQQYSRFIVAKHVDAAFQAAQQAEWLALLRLGETENAILNLENVMGINITAIAQWAAVEPPGEQDSKSRDAFLTNVKVYYDNYPASRPDETGAKVLLAGVPPRNRHSACKAGICRLDDLRLAKTNSEPPSP